MLFFLLYFILYFSNYISLFLQILYRLFMTYQSGWDLLTYDGFKSHVNFTEGLEKFAEERIRVGKEKAGTSAFNQSYDKYQAK